MAVVTRHKSKLLEIREALPKFLSLVAVSGYSLDYSASMCGFTWYHFKEDLLKIPEVAEVHKNYLAKVIKGRRGYKPLVK